MGMKRMKGYFLTVFNGLVLLAAVVLLTLQWGNSGGFSLYGKNIPNANIGLVMLLSVLAGVLLPRTLRAFLRGIGALRKTRKVQ